MDPDDVIVATNTDEARELAQEAITAEASSYASTSPAPAGLVARR